MTFWANARFFSIHLWFGTTIFGRREYYIYTFCIFWKPFKLPQWHCRKEIVRKQATKSHLPSLETIQDEFTSGRLNLFVATPSKNCGSPTYTTVIVGSSYSSPDALSRKCENPPSILWRDTLCCQCVNRTSSLIGYWSCFVGWSVHSHGMKHLSHHSTLIISLANEQQHLLRSRGGKIWSIIGWSHRQQDFSFGSGRLFAENNVVRWDSRVFTLGLNQRGIRRTPSPNTGYS